MARLRAKELTAAIRAPFRSWMGLPVAKTANANSINERWSKNNGFEDRWRNAADTDDVRALSVDAADNVKLAGKTLVPRLKALTFNIPLAGVNDAIDQPIFVAPGACRIAKIVEIHQTAETTAATATLFIEKLTGTQAVGAGTSVMSGTFDLKATALTAQTATLAGDSDSPLLRLAAGDRLGANFTYTVAAAADDLKGVQVTVYVEQDVDAIWLPFVMTQVAACVDQHAFIADRDYIMTGAVYAHAVKSSNNPSKLQITKCTGAAQAPASGAVTLANNTNTGFDCYGGVANTVQTGTMHATTANLRLAPGNTLAFDFGTVTALKGVTVTIVLQAREDLQLVTMNYPHNTGFDDQLVFIADRNYEVVSASAIWTTAGATGNVQLTRDTGTTGAGAGTDLIALDTNAGWQSDATAATTEVATWKDTRWNHLMASDRLGLDYASGANLVGFTCTVSLKPE